VLYAYFARAGFTEAARAEGQSIGAILVDMTRPDHDLRVDLQSIKVRTIAALGRRPWLSSR